MDADKQAKINAKFQAKIDKIKPQLQSFRTTLEDYHEQFGTGEEVDKKEQREITKMLKKIERAEAKVAKWEAKVSFDDTANNSTSSSTIDRGAERAKKVKNLKKLKSELEVLIITYNLSKKI